jgi:hypothetical protein
MSLGMIFLAKLVIKPDWALKTELGEETAGTLNSLSVKRVNKDTLTDNVEEAEACKGLKTTI